MAPNETNEDEKTSITFKDQAKLFATSAIMGAGAATGMVVVLSLALPKYRSYMDKSIVEIAESLGASIRKK